MITVTETVETRLDPDRAFDYLHQFEHTPEWDPGTPVSTKMTSGPVAVGTRYNVQVIFRGKRSSLVYVVTELEAHRIQLRGENKRVLSIDTITVEPRADGGSAVTYLAEFSVRGVFKIAEPFLKPAFEKLGPPAAAGMSRKLDSLIGS